MIMHYAAIDIGASSGRLLLGSLTDEKKFHIDEIHRFPNGITEIDNSFFWDIDALFKEIVTGLQKLAAQGITECIIGIDTWGVDYVLIDKDGKRLAKPYAYRDKRTDDAIERFNKLMPLSKLYSKTGIQILNINSLFQLISHDPEELKKADKILLIPDYLNYCLTGTAFSEMTNTSTAQLLNLETRDFDNDLLELLGLKRSQFGKLVAPSSHIGTLSEEICKEYSLPSYTVVNAASHDTASAIVGVPAKDKDFAYLSSGTWSLLGIETNKPINSSMAFDYNFTNEWGAENTFRVLKNIMGLWIIQEVRRSLDNSHTFAEIVIQAEKVEPFSYILDCNDKRFLNPDNMIEAIQSYCRESGQPVPESVGELGRAVFDSLALIYRKAFEESIEISGKELTALHIVGGGSQNALLCQLTADLLNRPVYAGPIESTAIGNLITQMIATGEISNVKEGREVVAASETIITYDPNPNEKSEAAYKKFLEMYN